RTDRLDLDDYNNDTEDGLHITSMAGTWMSVVEGFAGMRVRNGQLHFAPFLPAKWSAFAFKVRFRGAILQVHIDQRQVQLTHVSGREITVWVHGTALSVAAGATAGLPTELIKA
ncbi:MAG TPA: glycosyl hydrolase family 65 protein, partial [Chitinophaga sp.]